MEGTILNGTFLFQKQQPMSTQTTLKLRDYLNMDADSEQYMFLQGTKRKTVGMKYDQFVKKVLPPFRQMIIDYLKEEVEPRFKLATTVTKIEEIKIPALPDRIRDAIVDIVDKDKTLNIVEKTYLCLDLLRAVSSELGSTIGRMAMHYARALQMAPKIVGLDGQSL